MTSGEADQGGWAAGTEPHGDEPCLVLFVVGADRSGTTLLQSMLTNHPDLAIPPESHVLPAVLDLAPGPHLARRCCDLLFGDPRIRRWGLDHDEVLRAVEAARPSGPASAVEVLYRCYAAAQGKRLAGDKTPAYVRHLPRLAAAFPHAAVVHLVRDGRDVAPAMVAASWGHWSNLPQAAGDWAAAVRTGRRDGIRLGHRYLEVRYEDLVTDPEATLRTICDHVGLPWDARVLDHRASAHVALEGSARPEFHGGLTSELDPNRRNWRRDLDPAEVARIEAIAGRVLVEAGYARAGGPVRWSDRLAAHLARLRGRTAKRLLLERRRFGRRRSALAARTGLPLARGPRSRP